MNKLIFIILWMSTLSAYTADWGRCWIRSRQNDTCAQLWFRRTYVMKSPVQSATAYICSNARYLIYINEYNINDDVLVPCYNEHTPKNAVAETAYDVGNFFQNGNDTTVIAIWYAPDYRNNSDKQLSVQIVGILENGNPFELHTDSTWFCHEANTRNDCYGNEQVDANTYQAHWKSINCGMTDWHPASQACRDTSLTVDHSPWIYSTGQVKKIHYPIASTVRNDSIIYDFGHVYNGTIRLTMRGMEKGSRIFIDGLTYICRGVDDEQTFRRFTTTSAREISVSGDEGFSPQKITKAEFLEIAE